MAESIDAQKVKGGNKKDLLHARFKSLPTASGVESKNTTPSSPASFKTDTKAKFGDVRLSVDLKPTTGT